MATATDKDRINELERMLTAAEFEASGYQAQIGKHRAEIANLHLTNSSLIGAVVAVLVFLFGAFL
jgi:hypothetical protein